MHLFTKARLLTPPEWDRLAPLSAQFGGAIPAPEQAQILVVEDAGEIVGVATCEPIFHFGPVWVKEGYRGRGVFETLARGAFDLLPTSMRGWICFTSNLRLVKLLNRLGLSKVPAMAFKWERPNG